MDQLRNGTGRPKKSYSDLEDELKMLNAYIEKTEKEFEDMFNNLSTENKSLKIKIRDLLRCDQCKQSFEQKETIQMHIQSRHKMKQIDCNNCDQQINTKDEMNIHVIRKHNHSKQKENLKKKYDELISKVNNQKLKIFDDVLVLKQRENKEK